MLVHVHGTKYDSLEDPLGRGEPYLVTNELLVRIVLESRELSELLRDQVELPLDELSSHHRAVAG